MNMTLSYYDPAQGRWVDLPVTVSDPATDTFNEPAKFWKLQHRTLSRSHPQIAGKTYVLK
jgi:hypothetical protein